MKKQAKIVFVSMLFSFVLGGIFFSFFNEAGAVWSGGGYYCSTSHVCYDNRYACDKPSWLDCPGGHVQVNCDGYSTCKSTYNGWSMYYSCGYDNVICSDTRYCTFVTGVASWSPCSPAGVQWATSYSYSTSYGTTSCADSDFETTRLCKDIEQ